ncbi:phage major tail tube protein [Mesorhizobium sp. B2-5-9]|uniref:phage major tail tube protein n=1 Tax=Mesorhizobium sp. B2-5-9 TaxID=2589921 RepID=UPI00112CDD09|nr:phage major tail tube protein [Mesorhizobium sp. B2-5-9]TPK15159.1 phage major tail tube protein [Mesorhizobium sp. B2-5-9]
MANNNPRFILRNCTLWADRQSKLGQIGDITLPVPQQKMEEMRNGGMAMPFEVSLGYEKLEASFKMPGLDPQVLKLFGLKPGTETPFMVTGATVDEDGTEHSAVATIRGLIKQADHGNWKPGDMAENDYQVAIRYYKLEIDGDEIIEADGFDVKIGGVSQYQGIRSALLLD